MVLFIVISSCFSRYCGSGKLEYIVFTCFMCSSSELIIFLPAGWGLLGGGGAPHLWWVGVIFVQVVKWGSAKLCPNVRRVCYCFKAFLHLIAPEYKNMPFSHFFLARSEFMMHNYIFFVNCGQNSLDVYYS